MPGHVETSGCAWLSALQAHYDTYLEEMNSTVIERCNSDMLRILPEVMLKKFGLVE